MVLHLGHMIFIYQTHAIIIKQAIRIFPHHIISQQSHTLIINNLGQRFVEQQVVKILV